MRNFVIFCVLFFAATFADEICPTTSCVNGGQACTSYDACTRCSDAFTACVTAAGANATEGCTCAKTFATCLYTKPQCEVAWSAVQTACDAFPNCTCATKPTPASYSFLTCRPGYYCAYASPAATTATCLANRTPGQSCNKSSTVEECGKSDIFDNLFRSFACETETGTTNTICVQRPYGSDNDLCTSNSNCYSDTCTNGKCVGKPSGESCVYSAQCAFGLYCDAGTCGAEVADGAACNPIHDQPCHNFRVCGAGDTCSAYFTKANGADCRTDVECSLGLSCINKTCRAFSGARIRCNSTNDNCADYLGFCTCDGTSTSKYCSIRQRSATTTQECHDAAQTLETCLNTNKCDNFDYTSQSCGSQFCKAEADCLFDCFTSQTSAGCGTFPEITCASDDSAAAFLTISLGAFIAVMSLF